MPNNMMVEPTPDSTKYLSAASNGGWSSSGYATIAYSEIERISSPNSRAAKCWALAKVMAPRVAASRSTWNSSWLPARPSR